jgi:hypothetical protein
MLAMSKKPLDELRPDGWERFERAVDVPGDRASALHYLGRSREARPLQIAPEFAHASVEVVGS